MPEDVVMPFVAMVFAMFFVMPVAIFFVMPVVMLVVSVDAWGNVSCDILKGRLIRGKSWWYEMWLFLSLTSILLLSLLLL